MNSLETTEAASAAVVVNPNTRVSLASMEAKILRRTIYRHDILTICVLEMQNGFYVVGKTAPADPANYSAELGERFAYEDAIRQLWPLEGYVMRERLAQT